MASWTAAAWDIGATAADDGDLLRLGVSLFLGVFIVSLVWTLSSGRRSAPPF